MPDHEKRIESLIREINADFGTRIKFFQQKVNISNMGLEFGRNDRRGRLYIVPRKSKQGSYYISPQGAELEKVVSGEFENLFRKKCDGYRQPEERCPHWSTDDWLLVVKAARIYANFGKNR